MKEMVEFLQAVVEKGFKSKFEMRIEWEEYWFSHSDIKL